MSAIWHSISASLPAVKVFIYGVVVFTILEQIFPAERRQPLREQFHNLQYVVLYYLLTPVIMIWPTALVAAIVQSWGAGLIHIDLDRIHVGTAVGIAALDWPVRNILLPFAPAIVYDFFYYWHHRLQHRSPVFWPIHRLHHSTVSLNALAAFRIHWLEEPMRVLTMTVPTVLLFHITPVEGAWIAFALGQLATFIHVNIRLPFGRFTPVLMGPQLHRLHHSFKPEHLDRNYSAIFPVWDVLFGTYVPPKPGEWPETGLAGGERARSLVEESTMPFAMWGKSAAGAFRNGRKGAEDVGRDGSPRAIGNRAGRRRYSG